MLHDYLRSTLRNSLRNKLTTFINVAGLALGLAVFFALFFYVHREFSYDKHWQNAERIYRLNGAQEAATGNSFAFLTWAPYALGTSLQSRHPEAFEVYARVYDVQGSSVTIKNEPLANQTVYYAEPALLKLLQWQTVSGDLQEVFADPHAIAISAKSATQYFGTESPLGKTVTVAVPSRGKTDYVVKAVYRLPDPTSLDRMGFLALFDPGALGVQQAALDSWNFSPQQQPLSVTHYFKLQATVAPKTVESELRSFMDQNKYMDYGNSKTRFSLQPLQDVHLAPSPFDSGNNVERLWVYAAIGVLVLLVSGCNFVMLATLRSVERMREVGIRKTVGAAVTQLMQQYLLDAFCHTLLAALLAVLLLQLGLPKLQALLKVSFELDLLGWRSLGVCLLIVTGFTLLSSAYPALLLSRGKPVLLLRSSGGALVSSGNTLRKLLVGIQFATVIVLLLASAVVQQQIRFTQQRDRGYSLENIVSLRVFNADAQNKVPTLIEEFAKLPGVQLASTGGVSPGTIMVGTPNVVKLVTANGDVKDAQLQGAAVGSNYFKTMSVNLLAGREFAADDAPPAATPGAAVPAAAPPIQNAVLNSAGVAALGFTESAAALEQLFEQENVGQDGKVNKQTFRIIGVVADTQFASVMLPPIAQYYRFAPSAGFVAVKLDPGTQISAVKPAMESVWQSVVGNVPFTPLTADSLEYALQREKFEANIVIGSTLLAVVIALLGLYGLVAATMVKRVKEIGVRKVMGADTSAIVGLLLWQFSKPILAANVVAWPFGFWAITQWLQRFPYRLDTTVIMLSGAGASLLALLIAWLTVGFMAAKAANAKPVLALRYE